MSCLSWNVQFSQLAFLLQSQFARAMADLQEWTSAAFKEKLGEYLVSLTHENNYVLNCFKFTKSGKISTKSKHLTQVSLIMLLLASGSVQVPTNTHWQVTAIVNMLMQVALRLVGLQICGHTNNSVMSCFILHGHYVICTQDMSLVLHCYKGRWPRSSVWSVMQDLSVFMALMFLSCSLSLPALLYLAKLHLK